MRLVRPAWLAHRDENRTFEVYSLDVSSDGHRVVTGGLDSKVKVWSAQGVAHPDAEQTPKLLSSMSAHTGAVTAVKFSPDGRFIASGSDDRIVLISELDTTRQPRREFGTKPQPKEEQETEVWTPRKRLVGHDNDVQDLAWSPDGQLLVSVGLDSAIIVWSGTTFEKLKRLDLHNSHVKGVTFDPANKFFVTCSDDRSARIVRYSRASPTELSFSVEAVVQHAFVDSPLTSYFRRCSWSPDGECIACPNATNGPIPTVAIIDRGQWHAQLRHQTSLVGHEGTTEVAKFSPRMYSQGSTEMCVVATAGEDGSVAVWSTANPRPLVVVRNVATKLITDLAWSQSGLQLYACSLDGSVVLIEFGASDMGSVMPLRATQTRLEKYGNATDLMDIPQSVAQIDVQKSVEETEGITSNQAPNTISTTTPVPVATPVAAPIVASVAAPIAAPTISTNNDTATDNITATTTGDASKTPEMQVVSTDSPDSTAATKQKSTVLRQKTSVTRDGRRRVAPMLLNSAGPSPVPTVASAQSAPNPLFGVSSSTSIAYDRPSTALPPGGISSLVVGNKRRADDDPAPASTRKNKEETVYLRPVALNPSTTVSQLRLSTPRVVSHISSDPAATAVLEARNGTRPGDPTRVQVVSRGQAVFVDFVPEHVSLLAGSAEYFWVVASDTGVIYVYTPQGARALPPLVLGAPVSLLETTKQYLCALTATGMVFAWDISNRRALFTPLSVAPCLDVGARIQDPNAGSNNNGSGGNSGSGGANSSGNNNNSGAVASTNGSASASTSGSIVIGGGGSGGANTDTTTVPHNSSSHAPVNTNAGTGLLRAPQITYCRLTAQGEVVLATSTGSVFHYDTMLQTWQRICEGFWAYGSRFWDSTASRAITGPLALAEQLTNEEALLRAGARGRQLQRQAANRSVQAGFQGFERAVSLSHLSNRVASARALHSQPEYEHAVEQYVRKLAENGDRLKLGEAFRQLQYSPPLLARAFEVAAEYKGVQTLVAEYKGTQYIS